MRFAFDHTWAGDEKERLAAAELDGADRDLALGVHRDLKSKMPA